jgi:serine/threonine-protein kinase
VLGTAAYLAPEQASGAVVGPPADLYGLGVVTYQLLAGRLPYDASSLTELAMMQQREYPIRLDEVAPEVPAALALAVEKALALAPGDRYASADEMRAALHEGARGIAPAGVEDTAATALLARNEPTAATRAVPPNGARSARRLEPTPAPGPVVPHEYEPIPEVPPSRRDMPPPRRGAGGRILAVVLVIALVAALIAFAIGNSQGGSSVKLSPVDGDTTSDIVDQMTTLIDDNTR